MFVQNEDQQLSPHKNNGSGSNSNPNVVKSPYSSGSNNGSRHHQLVKKLSVVFEKDEMDLLDLVVDGIST